MTSYATDQSTVAAPPQGSNRLLAGWTATQRPADLAAHLARYGRPPLAQFAGATGAATLIETVRAAGLRGRGGAWFPTATKLAAVASCRRRSVLVANGCEGEPASDKDHALLTVAPHLVADGMALAAQAIGATEVVLCVRRGDPLAGALRAAFAQRTGDPIAPRVVEVPDRYVASEESALTHFLNGGAAVPTAKPPRPFERGVHGRPTLIDNVETLAHLALLARYGAGWFRAQGTATAPGTTLATVAGTVVEPGVRELPVGATVDEALAAAGGARVPLGAVLVGGYGGSWLGMPSAGAARLDPDGLRKAGAALGVAMVLALPEHCCGVMETARIVRYLAGESARQCGPCMFGLPAIAEDLVLLARGIVPRGDLLGRLRGRLGVISGRGACGHPDGATRLAASMLTVFAADVRAHAAGRPCRWAGDQPVLRVPALTGAGADWR